MPQVNIVVKDSKKWIADVSQEIVASLKLRVWDKISHITSETIGLIAVIIFLGATIPSLIAMMTGLTDKPPAADLVLLVWLGLLLVFIKSVIQKDMLILFTIGVGFIIQASLLVLIFFK